MSVSREEIIWAYKILLGREPESEQAIANRLQDRPTRFEMIAHIVDSEEFKARHKVA